VKLEGVLLTGGASRRLGPAKAALDVDGVFLSHRVARVMSEVCEQVTVLGREPIEGFAFLADSEEYGGPLVALSSFQPSADRVFVASCDLPNLTAEAILRLASLDGEAVVPRADGLLQPLCAVYSASAFDRAREVGAKGGKSMMKWLEEMSVVEVKLEDLDLDPIVVANVNTPDEWQVQVRLVSPTDSQSSRE